MMMMMMMMKIEGRGEQGGGPSDYGCALAGLQRVRPAIQSMPPPFTERCRQSFVFSVRINSLKRKPSNPPPPSFYFPYYIPVVSFLLLRGWGSFQWRHRFETSKGSRYSNQNGGARDAEILPARSGTLAEVDYTFPCIVISPDWAYPFLFPHFFPNFKQHGFRRQWETPFYYLFLFDGFLEILIVDCLPKLSSDLTGNGYGKGTRAESDSEPTIGNYPPGDYCPTGTAKLGSFCIWVMLRDSIPPFPLLVCREREREKKRGNDNGGGSGTNATTLYY
ncbi:hypothetical protein H6P81_000842 [Aristolochia fimbriata]|uniref:Uncharacterized protein n=1 Tax=Aristolochia fimbriata TaxID=158543 RepID=A0AAV7F6P4_ARIFI|nr:hypothetical protein H6P81_000842 [Aristolochia fimbriata]